VLVEAMASGLPVAAYPVAGPLDVVGRSDAGVLDEDLSVAIAKALRIPRAAAIAHAQGFSWNAAASQFEAAVVDCVAVYARRRRLKGLRGGGGLSQTGG